MSTTPFPIMLPRLKELTQNDPSPEARELLWEISRLRQLLRMDRLDIEAVRAPALVVGGGIHAGIEKMYLRLKNESAAQ